MKAYFWVFINLEQNNIAKLLLMADNAYNNDKNTSTSYISFKLNYGYHLYIFFKADIDLGSQFKIAENLASVLRDLMMIYWENLLFIQKLPE